MKKVSIVRKLKSFHWAVSILHLCRNIILYSYQIWWRIAYCYTKDSKELRKLKNKHVGEKCFIIGNGPSLTLEDINCLRGSITFASNRIYDVFSKTDWRPTYYVAIDLSFIREGFEEISTLSLPHKFINRAAKLFSGMKKENGEIFVFYYEKRFFERHKLKQQSHSRDISKYMTDTSTVTASAIEIALYMGFSEMILLGVDHSYSKIRNIDGKIKDDAGIQDYSSVIKAHSFTPIATVDAMESSYRYFEKFTRENNIRILNATRGGKLEVFERVSFDSLFANSKDEEEG